MNIKTVLIVGRSNFKTIAEELGDVLSKEDIVVRVIEDNLFNDMFSKKENVEIDLPDDVFIELAKIAHEQDITFNQLANNILREELEKYDNNKER